MNCHKVQSLLIPFLEGDLSGEAREKVDAHIKLCAVCYKEKELLAQSWQMLDNYDTPKLKEDFTSSLMKKIHLEQTKIVNVKYRLPQFTFRPLVPVLASLLIAVLTISLFWNRTISKDRLAKISPIVSPAVSKQADPLIIEDEIIENLDILQNFELLENLNLLSDLDVIENLDTLTS